MMMIIAWTWWIAVLDGRSEAVTATTTTTTAKEKNSDLTNLFSPTSAFNSVVDTYSSGLLQKFEEEHNTNPCWSEVVQLSFWRRCASLRNIHTEEKSRVAVKLANCHLEQSGLASLRVPCDDYQEITECTTQMATAGPRWQAYTQFFNHIDNLCAYVSKSSFQQSVEGVMSELIVGATATATQLQQFANDAQKSTDALSESVVRGKEVIVTELHHLHKEQADHFSALHNATRDIEQAHESIRHALQVAAGNITKSLEQSLTLQHNISKAQEVSVAVSAAIHRHLAALFTLQESIATSVKEGEVAVARLSTAQQQAFSQHLDRLKDIAHAQNDLASGVAASERSLVEVRELSHHLALYANQSLLDIKLHQEKILQSINDTRGSIVFFAQSQKELLIESFDTLRHLQREQAMMMRSMGEETKARLVDHSSALTDASLTLSTIHQQHRYILDQQGEVLEKLSDAREFLDDLKQHQNISFQDTIDSVQRLREESERAQQTVTSVLNQIMGGVESVLHVDHTILSHLFSVSTLLFYGITIVIVYVATIPHSTRSARVWCVCLLVAANFWERSFPSPYGLSWCRKLCLAMIFTLLIITHRKYKDWREMSAKANEANLRLTAQLLAHVALLQEQMQNAGLVPPPPEAQRQLQPQPQLESSIQLDNGRRSCRGKQTLLKQYFHPAQINSLSV